MGIVLFFKKRAEKAKEERQEFCKKILLVFYSKKYEAEAKVKDNVDIPYFIKAKLQVENLEKCGLVEAMCIQLCEAGCL